GLGVGISSLCIRQGAQFVEGVQVGAREAVRLSLIEVGPQSDVSVGEGENGLGLRQGVEVEFPLADAPLLDREGRMFDHRRPPNLVMSETTMSALRRSIPVQKSAVIFARCQVSGSGMNFSLLGW